MKNVILLLLMVTCFGCEIVEAQQQQAVSLIQQETAQIPELHNIFTMRRWSPYAAGIVIGVLSWLAFLLSNKPIGVSSAYARTCGMIGMLFNKEKTRNMEYFQKHKPAIDWEWMLVAGLFVGAVISARLSGEFHLFWLPSMWATQANTSVIARLATALAGGVLVGFGARMARGCTSGHGISGTLQLALSSWVSVICFFIGGVFIVRLLF